MKIGEQPSVDPMQENIKSAQGEIPPAEAEGDPLTKMELDPVMEEITEQVRIENETTSPGILSRLPEWLKKPIKVMMLAGTLSAGMGVLNEAEAGGRHRYTPGDALRDGLAITIGQTFVNVANDLAMKQQMKYRWEQTQMNLAAQEQRKQLNQIRRDEQAAKRKAEQREKAMERALKIEADRFGRDIVKAKGSEEMETAKKKHAILKAEIEKNFTGRSESREEMPGQQDNGSDSFSPRDREGL